MGRRPRGKPRVPGGSFAGMLERARPRLSPGAYINGLEVRELVGVGGFGTVY